MERTGGSVVLFATGTRNAYGIRVGLKGNVMLTVNGPNLLFGAELTGLDVDGVPMSGPDPETDDAMWVDLREVWWCCSLLARTHAVDSGMCSDLR